MLLDEYTFITITASSICLYVIVKYIDADFKHRLQVENIFCSVGQFSFGIYLLGDLVLNESQSIFTFLERKMHVVFAIVLWEIIIFNLCYYYCRIKNNPISVKIVMIQKHLDENKLFS